MLDLIKCIKEYRYALGALTSVEVKTSIAETRIGIFWWVLDPLIMMMIYYFVVSVVFNRGGPNYHLFILCGIISWGFFSSALTGSSSSIFSNKTLIQQINAPLSLIVMVKPIARLFFALFGIVIIIIWNISLLGWHTLAIIPLLFSITLLSYGLGLFLAVVNVFFTDMSKLISYVLRAGFFLSPVLFPASRIMDSEKVPDLFKTMYGLNPMGWIITSMRSILLDGQMFRWQEFLILMAVIVVIIQTGLIWLRMNTSRIVKML